MSNSGSFSSRTTDLESTDSVLITASSSFSLRTTNTETTTSNLISDSGSFSTRFVILTNASNSFGLRNTNLESTASTLVVASNSFSNKIDNLVAASASLSIASSSFSIYTPGIFSGSCDSLQYSILDQVDTNIFDSVEWKFKVYDEVSNNKKIMSVTALYDAGTVYQNITLKTYTTNFDFDVVVDMSESWMQLKASGSSNKNQIVGRRYIIGDHLSSASQSYELILLQQSQSSARGLRYSTTLYHYSQTFIPTESFSLNKVELMLGRTGNPNEGSVWVEIWSGSDSVPIYQMNTSQQISSSIISASGNATWHSFDFNQTAEINSGGIYHIYFKGNYNINTESWVSWFYTASNVFSDGLPIWISSNDLTTTQSNQEHTFKIYKTIVG
jgi:hypothetical protein